MPASSRAQRIQSAAGMTTRPSALAPPPGGVQHPGAMLDEVGGVHDAPSLFTRTRARLRRCPMLQAASCAITSRCSQAGTSRGRWDLSAGCDQEASAGGSGERARRRQAPHAGHELEGGHDLDGLGRGEFDPPEGRQARLPARDEIEGEEVLGHGAFSFARRRHSLNSTSNESRASAAPLIACHETSWSTVVLDSAPDVSDSRTRRRAFGTSPGRQVLDRPEVDPDAAALAAELDLDDDGAHADALPRSAL